VPTLETFIVRAKAATYVGGGAFRPPSRPGAHDIGHEEGSWRYLDSYFGGTDFIGEEVVWRDGAPVWAMNYYGRILRPDVIDAAGAGAVIKEALSAMCKEGRFLGGFEHRAGSRLYVDASIGSVESFTGVERILIDGAETYRLDYHGGLIKA
jgi:hypothetical protein